jgi:hypothetical protein
VLPAVYDDSLSYYEVLCKTRDYINKLIDNDVLQQNEINQLQQVVAQIQKWIDDFDTTYIKELVEEYLHESVKDVVFGLSSEGYFMALIPSKFDEIEFGTIQSGELYGHLVLAYD